MTKTPGVTYFDLDDVLQDKIVIKLFGEEHTLRPVTVEDFINNTKEQEQLETVPEHDLAGQLGLTKQMLLRAFPTLPEDIFSRMTMLQLNKLVQLAHGMNGQKEAEAKSAEVASAVPQTAAA